MIINICYHLNNWILLSIWSLEKSVACKMPRYPRYHQSTKSKCNLKADLTYFFVLGLNMIMYALCFQTVWLRNQVLLIIYIFSIKITCILLVLRDYLVIIRKLNKSEILYLTDNWNSHFLPLRLWMTLSKLHSNSVSYVANKPQPGIKMYRK